MEEDRIPYQHIVTLYQVVLVISPPLWSLLYPQEEVMVVMRRRGWYTYHTIVLQQEAVVPRLKEVGDDHIRVD